MYSYILIEEREKKNVSNVMHEEYCYSTFSLFEVDNVFPSDFDTKEESDNSESITVHLHSEIFDILSKTCDRFHVTQQSLFTTAFIITLYKHTFQSKITIAVEDIADKGVITLSDELYNEKELELLLSHVNQCISECKKNTYEKQRSENKTTSSKLYVKVWEESKGYKVVFSYRTGFFSKSLFEYFVRHFICILQNMQENTSIGNINVMQTDELLLVKRDFSGEESTYNKNITVIDLFEQQVSEKGNQTAVVFGKQSKTYQQIDETSDKIAMLLSDCGIVPDDFVAILSERSCEMIEGIYGIIKSGAAYVSIEPSYPKQRINYILADCKAKAILVYEHNNSEAYLEKIKNLESIKNNKIKVISIANNTLRNVNPKRERCKIDSRNLMYGIYTSGTTGNPKGVMVEHRNVTYLACKHPRNVFGGAIKDDVNRILGVTTMTFDIFLVEAVLSLACGMQLFLAEDKETNDPQLLAEFIELNKIQVIQTTPSRMRLCLHGTKKKEYLKYLKVIILGGEPVPKSLCDEIRTYTDAKIFNGYGPSEATVYATLSEIKAEDKKVTIGKPLANSRIYIMNKDNLCGIGIPGELCIAGDGVSRGYCNNQKLTDEKFVKSVFGSGKMYHSGDLARWMPDGTIDFLGRIDEQVKIRGFRVEIGEVTNAIRSISYIEDVAVIARENESGINDLCAYFVSSQNVITKDLRKELENILPYYMVPAYMMQIDKIPVTQNGKVDKKALPKMQEKAIAVYKAPSTTMERFICEAFTEVLKLEQVSVDDGFFHLGGHSLRAAKLINIIEERKGIRLFIYDIFRYSTPKKIAAYMEGLKDSQKEEIPLCDEKPYYRVSPAQKRMYLVEQLNRSTAYNLTQCLQLDKEVSVTRLKDALYQVVLRHEILRTRFVIKNGVPVQEICDEPHHEFSYKEDATSSIKELLDVFVRPFDLSEPSQLRVCLVKRNSGYILLTDMHHIINDGMSQGIFIKEVVAAYNQDVLPELVIQYKDYSEWVTDRDISCQKDYWLGKFDDNIPVLNLPTDYTRPNIQSYRGEQLNFTINGQTRKQIEEFAFTHGVTEYMVFLTGLFVTLSKYTLEKDIVIGSATSGRVNCTTEHMLGMFVNTLAMRACVDCNVTAQQFLKDVKKLCLEAFENQDYPLEELIESLGLHRDLSRNPLFDVMFVFQNNEYEEINLGESRIIELPVVNNKAMFDITFEVIYTHEGYQVNCLYCVDLFTKETITGMVKRFICILKECVQQPDKKLAALTGIGIEEQKQILDEFNKTSMDYEREKTIVELFREQAEQRGDKKAVVCSGQSITYQMLDRRSDAIAKCLIDQNVGEDDFVMLLAEKSIEAILGIVGILKSGAAYVPVDLFYPDERIRYMIEDCKPKAILICDNGKKELKRRIQTVLNNEGIAIPVIDLDEQEVWKNDGSAVTYKGDAHSLAYCIYTSGTTGKPKGSLIEHRSVIRLVNHTNYVPLNENTTILLTGSIAFDASTFEIWGALLNGGTLVVAELDVITNPEILKSYIVEYKVNTMWMTSMLFNQLIMMEPDLFDSLEYLLIGGEKLSEEHVRFFKSRNNSVTLINGYGPTENTTFTTTFTIPDEFFKIPIGKPIANTTIYVMRENELCGIGVPGELCCGGDGVARGYLSSEELTKEKFLDNPYGEGKIYRTGDLVRWLPDGTLDYLGRMDQQIKIRGFRIELGEIEECIKKIPFVRNVTVVVEENDYKEKVIGAYVVLNDTSIQTSEIRSLLEKELPDYMIPSSFMKLKELPLTRNGKLDRRALPPLELASMEEYVPPVNEKEELICNVFSEILNLEKVGATSSFFELGGDSIKAIRMVSRIRSAGYACTVKDILNRKTVQAIAKGLTNLHTTDVFEKVTGNICMTPIMRWFQEQNFMVPGHFNQSIVLEKDHFDNHLLKEALDSLYEHHDILRAVFDNGQLKIEENAKGYDFYEYSVAGMTQDEIEDYITQTGTSIQGSIDISQGSLFKVALFTGDGKDYLLLVVHHLAVDGISFRILIEDLQRAYNQPDFMKQEVKTASLHKWAQALEAYETSPELLERKAYWEEVESKSKKCNRIEDVHQKGKLAFYSAEYDKEKSNQFVFHCQKAFHTRINDLFITALAMAVSKFTGQEMVWLGLEGHGRENIIQDLSIDRTVGWFTSYYPIVAEVKEGVMESIISVKEMLHAVPQNGISYSILRYGTRKRLQGNPAEIVFNYMGSFEEKSMGEEMKISSLNGGLEFSKSNVLQTGIMIDCKFVDGSLEFQYLYDSGRYSVDRIEELSNQFMFFMDQVVECCLRYRSQPIKTPSDYGLYAMEYNEFHKLLDAAQKKQEEWVDIYPLTPLQQGMFVTSLEEKEGAYFIQYCYECPDGIILSELEQALVLLPELEPVLKTKFIYDGLLEPLQVIVKNQKPEIVVIDKHDTKDIQKELEAISQKDVSRGFSLEKDSLFRVTVVKASDVKYYVVFSLHHIITDGWSMPVIWKGFLELYQMVHRGNDREYILSWIAKEKSKKSTYGDYVRWLKQRNSQDGVRYWKELLEGYDGQAGIASTGQKTDTKYPVKIIERKLSEQLFDKVRDDGRKLGVTTNTFVETAIGILLAQYNNTDDVVFGKVVSGRNAEISGIEEMAGMFINTIPLRIQIKETTKNVELIKAVQEQSVEGTKYDYIGLAQIQSATGGDNLIQTVLAFENYFQVEGGDSVEKASGDQNNEFLVQNIREQTNYDMDFTAYTSDGLYLVISYNPKCYGEQEVCLLLDRLELILSQLAYEPDGRVENIQTITDWEKKEISEKCNATDVPYPIDKTVVDLFEAQVAKTPERIAVEFLEETITYQELNRKANLIARRLKDEGVGAEDFVAIYAERSIETIIAIYGILKAGGAYVPMDPEYPEDRIKYMIDDCNPKVILTALKDVNLEVDRTAIDLYDQELYSSTLYDGGAQNLERQAGPENLCYAIYTSGTTGKPKGVLIEHRGLHNLMVAYTDIYKLTDKDVVLQVANYIFDQSVWDIFNILLIGGRLCLVPYDIIRNPEELEKYCNEKKVTIASFTPALINELNPDGFQTLRILDSSGEAANGDVLKKWVCKLDVVNTYGPTETTVNASSYYYRGEDLKSIPIGGPISNTKFYVLRKNHLCGIGMPGELCITGDSLSRGYLNRPSLTEEKFVDNPFGEGKMYRTGDLARWLPDGNIECMGRIDEQVKIRGFRIELLEVVAAIRKQKGIRDVAVIVKGDIKSEKAMHAYLVSDEELDIQQIKQLLAKEIPEYMIPTYMMQIDEIPVTRSGKVDRRSLPEIEMAGNEEFVEPETDTEKTVAKVFMNVLSLERAGLYDNFFEMGGDSIKAIRVVSKLREEGYSCTVKDIMAERTIKKIAACIEGNREEVMEYEQGEVTGRVELTPIVRDFFCQNIKRKEYYNQSNMLMSEKFDREALHVALTKLAEHHDMLRAVVRDQELYVRGINEGKLYDFYEFNLTGLEEQEEIEAFAKNGTSVQASMNLEHGPLFKAAIMKTDDMEHLFLVIHHLVVDGVSWRILIEDFMEGYNQYLKKGSIILLKKTASYQKWAKMLKEYQTDKKLEKEKKYWEKKGKELKACHIPKTGKESGTIGSVELEILEEDTYKLLHNCSAAYGTMINDLLIAGLGMAFHETTGMDRIAVEMEGHGREEIHKPVEIDRTVGWFTSAYPIIVETKNKVQDTIISTKEMFRNLPGNGLGYGVLMNQEVPFIEKEQVDISFNYLGEFEEDSKSHEDIQSSPFRGGNDESDENGLENSIIIVGIHEEQKLKFMFLYDKGLYEKAFIEKTAFSYREALKKIIECCEKAGDGNKTASDFNLKGDAGKDFEKALELLNDLI